MFFLLKNKRSGIIHRSVREGGGKMEIMMTACGLSIRWDQPHPNWLRAEMRDAQSYINCANCRSH